MQITQEHIDMVFRIAKVHANKRGFGADWGDYVTSGYIGLCDALEKFDESNGARFATFAQHRIRGAMLDQDRGSHRQGRRCQKRGEGIPHVSLSTPRLDGDKRESDFVSARPLPNEVESRDEVRHMTRHLNPRRQMIARMLTDDLTYPEMATAMDIGPCMISLEVKEIRRQLKKELANRDAG